MDTVEKVQIFIKEIYIHIDLFGASQKGLLELQEKKAAIADAILAENGMAQGIPLPSTILGAESQRLFDEMRAWIYQFTR